MEINSHSKKALNLCAMVSPFLLLISFVLSQQNASQKINAWIDVHILESTNAQPLSEKEVLNLLNAYSELGDAQSLAKAETLLEESRGVLQLDHYSRGFIAGRLGRAMGRVAATPQNELRIYERLLFDKDTEYIKELLTAKAYSDHGNQEKAREILNNAKSLSNDAKRVAIADELINSLDNPKLRMKRLNALINASRPTIQLKGIIPLRMLVDIILFLLLVILSGALANDEAIQAGWRTFWKSLFWINLCLLITKGVLVLMHWYVFFVETFLEPFVHK